MSTTVLECELGSSYSRGPEAEVWDKTIGEPIRETAARGATRDALVSCHQGLRYSWKELLAEAERVAAGLFALGINPGDRIGVWSNNCAG